MKSLLILLLSVLILSPFLSCRHNRLKTNEKELTKEILLQEKEEAEKVALMKKSAETGNRFSGGLRKKEIRSVDSGRPPIRIDIPGTGNNTRKFKLSEIASSIRYVKLQTPPDTLLLYDHFFYRSDLESNIRSDGEQIIFQGLFGLTRFNMQGEYQETIWKNKTGIRFYGSSMVALGGKDFYGVPFYVPVNIRNGDIYFTFLDGPTGNGQVMKYKSGTNKTLSAQSQTEIPGLGIIPGDTLFNTNKHTQERFDWIYGTSPDTWAGVNNKWNAGKSGAILVTYNDKGDTLCQFTDYDRIVNFGKTSYRQPTELVSYNFTGLLTIKQEYNDTVFRLISPDRLLPVYILDFGKYKFSFMDGFNPDFDLSDNYMLNSLHETNDFLFIRYTQNYDCPNTRKKNTVKFYNTIFYKKEAKLYHQPGFTLIPEGLVNDLDGGIPFWPDFVTPHGEMMKLVSGKIIKDYVNSSGFKEASVSEKDRQKQISMASGLKATDMIVVIVK
ncbi:MAG: DUF4933 domain-containing protein [Bacteroidia bacterium]|nr:DUF4933 domain-containing protein [Bacteroidia bacterium]